MAIQIEKSDMKTMVSCTNMLNTLGFATQFKAYREGLMSLATKVVYFPEEVEIVDFFRFEGESDPEDSAILYAIETICGERGTLTDAYGMYSDSHVTNFIKQVREIQKKVNGEKDYNLNKKLS